MPQFSATNMLLKMEPNLYTNFFIALLTRVYVSSSAPQSERQKPISAKNTFTNPCRLLAPPPPSPLPPPSLSSPSNHFAAKVKLQESFDTTLPVCLRDVLSSTGDNKYFGGGRREEPARICKNIHSRNGFLPVRLWRGGGNINSGQQSNEEIHVQIGFHLLKHVSGRRLWHKIATLEPNLYHAGFPFLKGRNPKCPLLYFIASASNKSYYYYY